MLCGTAWRFVREFEYSAICGCLGDRAFIVIDRQEKAQTPLVIGKAYKSELGRVNECF